MDLAIAAAALGALAHEYRLQAFRLLVQAGPGGLTPGSLAAHIGISAASMSFHVRDLLRAGLVQQRHEGRQIFYSARFEAMNELIAYLTENCCGGNPCSPLSQPACGADPEIPT